MRRTIATILACAAVLSTGVSTAQGVGEPAPEFELRTIQGETVSISDFHGAPLLLNFWATWCPPCREELPLFQEVGEESPDLQVFLINAGESHEQAMKYLAENDLDLSSAVNPSANGPHDAEDTLEVARRYRVRGMPTTFFIDADGVIQSIYVGEISAVALAERLSQIGVAWQP